MIRIASIQYLRAAAALAVVIHHVAFQLRIPLEVAAAGVDVFFVISGFIMVSMTLRADTEPLRFLWQRIARIAPLYWIITLGIAAPAILYPQSIRDLGPDLERLVLSLLFIPHLSEHGDPYPLLIPGWTLNYEMFFYILVAAGLHLPRRIRVPTLLATLVVLVLAGALLRPEAVALQAWTSPLLLEFAAGGVLGLLWARRRLPLRTTGVLLLGGGLAAFALLEILELHFEPWRFALWGVPAVMVVLGALSLEPASEPPPLKSLGLVGDASYSIYLLHPLVVMFAVSLVGREAPAQLFVLV
ncbi:acyltransferase, partial [Nostoc sp. NIES-2111]